MQVTLVPSLLLVCYLDLFSDIRAPCPCSPYAGAFPLWLAPVQCRLVPVNSAVAEYVARVAADLRAAGLRVEVVSGEYALVHSQTVAFGKEWF